MLTTPNHFIAQLFAALQDRRWTPEASHEVGRYLGDTLHVVLCLGDERNVRSFLIADRGERGYSLFLPQDGFTVLDDADAIVGRFQA